MQRYITFNESGFIEGLFNDDITPIPEDKEVFLITDRLCFEIANYEATSMIRTDNLIDTSIIYDDINLVLKPNPNPVMQETSKPQIEVLEETINSQAEQIKKMQGALDYIILNY